MRRARYLLELSTAVTLTPTFGGAVAGSCIGACRRAAGIGGTTLLRGGFRSGVGLSFGVAAGYLTSTQEVTGRETNLSVIGRAKDAGVADDRLRLRGMLLGAWVGFSAFDRLPLHLRLGAGTLLGSIYDARTFDGTASDSSALHAGPDIEIHSAYFFYVDPEIRLGLPLGRHIEMTLGLDVPILVSPSPPLWGPSSKDDPSHPIYASTDLAGSFPPDALLGHAVVLFAPGIGARYVF